MSSDEESISGEEATSEEEEVEQQVATKKKRKSKKKVSKIRPSNIDFTVCSVRYKDLYSSGNLSVTGELSDAEAHYEHTS